MKKFFKIWSVALLGVMGMTMSSCSDSNDDNNSNNNLDPYEQDWQGKTAKYTIMLYGCGGGDIDEVQFLNAIPYVQDRLNVEGNQVRFVVMYSMSKDDSKYREAAKKNRESYTGPFAPSYGEWGKTYRYEITPYITKENYHDYGYYDEAKNVELYDVETIKEYIKWAKETAPAENYILMPINHGGGFDLDNEEIKSRAIAYDDNQADEEGHAPGIPTKAFAQALEETDTHLKAIYWNGCMMGQLEVMTEVAPYCDYQFCGAHLQYAIERHIYAIVEALNTYPDANDFEKAALVQSGILDGPSKGDDTSFSDALLNQSIGTKMINANGDFGCWRSSGLAAINAQVARLAAVLEEGYQDISDGGGRDKIDMATRHVYMFDNDNKFIDVLDYALWSYHYLQTNETASIYNELELALNKANVYQFCRLNRKIVNDGGKTVYYKWPATNRYSLGISLYDQMSQTWKEFNEIYKASAFDKTTGWSKFLDRNLQEVEATTNPCNESSIIPFWLLD